jgi:hypothetical protein
MKPADCCLTLVFPKALEENMVELVLERAHLTGGFTTVEVEGHGDGAILRSIAERVRGRARRVKMQIVLNREDAGILLGELKGALPSVEIAYWITPIGEFGRFA